MAKTKTTDEAVMELLRTVQKKKEEIKALKKKPQWLTNTSFGFDPESIYPPEIFAKESGRVNIQTRRETELFLNFYAYLLQREEYLQKAASELGVKAEMMHLGYPIADWKADLKTRMGQLSIEQKQKEIDELDKRVNNLISPEQRREMELRAIQEILGAQS